MTTETNSRAKKPMTLIAVCIAAIALMGALFVPMADAAHEDISVTLAPSGDSDGSGSATLTFFPNNAVCFTIAVADIETPTLAHIHVGAEGVDGPVLIDFDPATNGLTNCVTAAADAIAAVKADPAGHYLNIHTADFPGGAIRGQLGAPSEGPAASATAELTLLPISDPDGGGAATVTLYPNGQVCYAITPTGIGAPTMAHIHQGAAGAEGDVVVGFDISSGLNDCVFSSPATTASIVGNLSGFYLNVHTEEFPSGAVRNQLDNSGTAPTATPEPEATAAPEATATAEATDDADADAAAATDNDAELAFTGAYSDTFAGIGFAVLGAGLVLVGAARRRNDDA